MVKELGIRSIEALVFEKARVGDEQALNELLIASQPDIRRYARRNCHSSDIDDATQEALWVLARRVGTVNMLISLPAWLFTVVKRECMRIAKKAVKGDPLQDIEQFDDDMQFSHKPKHELRIDLVHAIHSLPEHYRYVVLLRDIQGMTIEEIANKLNQSRESVKARLYRARLLIREFLN